MEEHTAPPGPQSSLPRMTRGALLRRAGEGAGAALAAAALLSNPTISIAQAAVAAKRSSTMSAKPSIVFAHGLYADGSCYSKVIPTLQAEGYEVLSAQNSLDSITGDAAAVTRALGRVSSPAILVGHSWGGAVITAAGTDPRVAGLVYISALAPDEGETANGLLGQYPTDLFKNIAAVDGYVWMLPSGIKYFAGDLSEQEQQLIWATQGVPTTKMLDQKIPGAAWKTKPSWFIVAKNDHSVSPDLQRFFVKRMGATAYEADSSHVVMLSNPKLVIDVIHTAAAHVAQVSTAG